VDFLGGEVNQGNGGFAAMAGEVVILAVHGIGPPPRLLDPGEDRTWVTVE
jgi:hypothetical protein